MGAKGDSVEGSIIVAAGKTVGAAQGFFILCGGAYNFSSFDGNFISKVAPNLAIACRFGRVLGGGKKRCEREAKWTKNPRE